MHRRDQQFEFKFEFNQFKLDLGGLYVMPCICFTDWLGSKEFKMSYCMLLFQRHAGVTAPQDILQSPKAPKPDAIVFAGPCSLQKQMPAVG